MRAGRSLTVAVVLSLVLTALVGGGIALTRVDLPSIGGDAVTDLAAAPAAPKAAATPEPARIVSGVRLRPTPQALRRARMAARAERLASLPVTFVLATFNVLGSNHTAPGGDRRKFPPASARTPQAAALIRQHGVSVVGLQEVKPDQLTTLQRLTGFAAYPGFAFGSKETDNSILYDTSRFEFVSGTSFPVVFESRARPQTVLRLRDRATGREMYFVNMHVSAGHDARDTASRIAGHLTGAEQVNRLMATGLPVFLTGDMNDRAEFFCRVIPRTGMVAAVGGSTANGCAPPARMPVDWVVASPGVSFSDYWLDETPVNRRISDHFLVSARATVPPAAEADPTED
ncbi:hypothetical protein GCM10022215_10550 [Nocardioides fonticola]|uniref:Endonuclease/exonuclease/phosphatase domain-containing protein n=2 Tax=Nocardioides fonticola TaxID=450363 RepID=A0ABP7XE93_9ACTN